MNELLGLVWVRLIRLLNPLSPLRPPAGAPAWRHIGQLADGKVTLNHAAEAYQLEVCCVEGCATQELPVPVRVVIDLADWFNALQNLASSENTSLDWEVEGPRMERVGMAHMRPNARIKPRREAASA